MEAAIIIGANGFVGRTLVSRIRTSTTSCPIFSLDIHFSNTNPEDKSNLYKCDLRDPLQVHYSFQEISKTLQKMGISKDQVVVFHLASYGMSSAEMVMRQQTFQVNVVGTQHVLDSCIRTGISHVVYTSTVNVVFGGQEIINGREEDFFGYFLNPCDEYSRSKAMAEQFILQQDPTRLKTVAIRSCAIYGPGEERHFPRIVQYFHNGLDMIQMGRHTLQDWIHVEDLVDAHLAAALSLLRNPTVVQGQAYFVSEGCPCSTMEMMDPFRTRPFTFHIPVRVAYILAFFLEYLFLILFTLGFHRKGHDGGIVSMLLQGPLMTRAEVNKVAITHFFSIEKAKRDLEWVPKVNPSKGREALYAFYIKDVDKLKGKAT